jgi:hypothetical protein
MPSVRYGPRLMRDLPVCGRREAKPPRFQTLGVHGGGNSIETQAVRAELHRSPPVVRFVEGLDDRTAYTRCTSRPVARVNRPFQRPWHQGVVDVRGGSIHRGPAPMRCAWTQMPSTPHHRAKAGTTAAKSAAFATSATSQGRMKSSNIRPGALVAPV